MTAEKPILFSATMAQAILDGSKTMTRRVLSKKYGVIKKVVESSLIRGEFHLIRDDGEDYYEICPYGRPGNRLWVKETWAAFDSQAIKDRDRSKVFYRADDQTNYSSDGKWKPSIFMPRWASRILLEVAEVRIERLQDISEENAKAEGADALICDNLDAEGYQFCKDMEMPSIEKGTPYKNGFALLWETINGPGAWDSNPWVWVISFRRIDHEPPQP